MDAKAADVYSDYFTFAFAPLLDLETRFELSEELRYESNINDSANKEEGWILNSGLSMNVVKDHDRFRCLLNGRFGYEIYLNKNSDYDDYRYSVAPQFHYNHGHWSLGVSGIASHTFENEDTSQGRERNEVTRTGISPVFDLHFSEKWHLALNGNWKQTYYNTRRRRNESYDTYGGSIAPYYVISPKVKVGTSIGYKEKEYLYRLTNNRDSNTVSLRGFVHYSPTERLYTSLSVGGDRKEYDNSRAKYEGDGDWKVAGDFNARYVLSSTMGLDYSFSIDPDDSSSSRGTYTRIRNSLGFLWKPNPKLSITQRVFLLEREEKGTASDYDEYGYSINARYKLRGNIALTGGYSYTKTDYKYRNSSDYDCHIVKMGLNYQF